jgi:hypothetical protein
MSKLAVVTRADDNIKKMAYLTHPHIAKYAYLCGADFIVYDFNPVVLTSDNRPHYRILRGKDDLLIYNRILFIDTDVIISRDCPNIFEEVPYNCIGSVFEDVGTRRIDRRGKIAAMQEKWGDVGWKTGYTNAGVFVVSDCHRGIFDSHDGEYWLEWGSADLHMSYMAHKHGYKFHELSYQWNHMTMFSEEWNGCKNRFDSYIIHYAGAGIFDCRYKNRYDQMRADMRKMI